MFISKQLCYQEKANVLDNIPENFLLPLTSVVINPNETFYGLPCQITSKYGLPGLLTEVYKSIQTLKSIQIQFPFFELSWIESLHKNGIQELSWITYLLEMNWVWIELFLSTKRKNWIWFESSLTQKNLKELRICKTWMRIHESTHSWLETFSLHHEISIESN